MTIEPELLLAYADGELDAVSAGRVERAIAADPALAAEVAAQRALTARLRGGFAGLDAQPLPAGVVALFGRGDNVVALPVAARRRAAPRWWGAIAASLVAGVLLGQLVPRGGGDLAIEGGTAVAQGSLARALDTQLASTQTAADPVRIGISFRRAGGDLCRTFTRGATDGIACAGKGSWRIERLYGGTGVATTAYAQAGSSEMMADAQAMATGEPLDAAAERSALAAR